MAWSYLLHLHLALHSRQPLEHLQHDLAGSVEIRPGDYQSIVNGEGDDLPVHQLQNGGHQYAALLEHQLEPDPGAEELGYRLVLLGDEVNHLPERDDTGEQVPRALREPADRSCCEQDGVEDLLHALTVKPQAGEVVGVVRGGW